MCLTCSLTGSLGAQGIQLVCIAPLAEKRLWYYCIGLRPNDHTLLHIISTVTSILRFTAILHAITAILIHDASLRSVPDT